METGHPSTRAINSGSGNQALVDLFIYYKILIKRKISQLINNSYRKLSIRQNGAEEIQYYHYILRITGLQELVLQTVYMSITQSVNVATKFI